MILGASSVRKLGNSLSHPSPLSLFIRNSSSRSSLPRPRLNYRAIAENPTAAAKNASIRKAGIPHNTAEQVASLYHETAALSRQVDSLRAARNTLGQAVRVAQSTPEREQAIRSASEAKARLNILEAQLAAKQDLLYSTASLLPNSTHPSTPLGPESSARLVSTHGPTPLPPSPSRDHVRVSKSLGLLDMESAATVSGSSWYYLRNEGALLELALTNYAMSMAMEKGFEAVMTPDVVRSDIAHRCGFQPRDGAAGSGQNYYLRSHSHSDAEHSHSPDAEHSDEGLVLAGTAEIPLAGLFASRTIPQSSLPIRVAGLGRAFRAEAGARGADTRGLYRVHQFSKVELFVVSSEEESERMVRGLLDVQKGIFDGLGLTYKVLEMPSEELGASAYCKYDIEAWMPGRGNWGEISSTSNCTDYQSRRLHITYAPSPSTPPSSPRSKHKFAHTLNGTAAAIPRLMVALIENGVVFEGDSDRPVGLNLPRALERFWLGGRRIVRFV